MDKVDIIRKHIGSDDFYGLNGTEMLSKILAAMDEYAQEQVKLFAIPGVSKRYKFTFKDVDTDQLIIIHEDTERKAFKIVFRTFETPKDRELKLVSKELNAC